MLTANGVLEKAHVATLQQTLRRGHGLDSSVMNETRPNERGDLKMAKIKPSTKQGNPGKVGGGGGVDSKGHPAAPPANSGQEAEGRIRQSTKEDIPGTRKKGGGGPAKGRISDK